MTDTPDALRWKGRDVREYSKEELIQMIYRLYSDIEAQRESARRVFDAWEKCRR